MKIHKNVGYESSHIFSVKITRAGENANARENCLFEEESRDSLW